VLVDGLDGLDTAVDSEVGLNVGEMGGPTARIWVPSPSGHVSVGASPEPCVVGGRN